MNRCTFAMAVVIVIAATAHAAPSFGALGAMPPPNAQRATATDARKVAWTQVELGAYEISFPGTPKETKLDVELPSGKQAAQRLEVAFAPDRIYVAARVWLMAGQKPIDEDAALDAALALAISTSGGKLDGATKSTVRDGFRARDARVILPNGAVLALRLVVSAGEMYVLEVADASRANADFFFSSMSPRLVGGLLGSGGAGSSAGVPRSTSRTTAKIADFKIEGGLDPAVVKRYLQRNIDKVQDCSETAVAATPGIAGKVITSFTIGFDGAASRPVAKGFDVHVADCIADVVQGIEFPKPKNKPVAATVTFVLTPGSH